MTSLPGTEAEPLSERKLTTEAARRFLWKFAHKQEGEFEFGGDIIDHLLAIEAELVDRDRARPDASLDVVEVLDKVLAGVNATPIPPQYRETRAYRDGWHDALAAVRDEFAALRARP